MIRLQFMSSNRIEPDCPALVIDGSASSFFSGVLGSDGTWLSHQKSPEPALESLFTTVDAVLQAAGLELEAIRSFIYCEGPGSVLGLRLCAMAIETWMRIHPHPTKLYAYNSLGLVAANLLDQRKNREGALLVSDWKKDTWNSLKIRSDGLEAVAPITAEELSNWQGAVYHLPARKGWQKPPDNAIEITYEPENLPGLLKLPELIELRQDVALYSSGINSFQKWTPDRHRAAPTAP